MPKVRTIYNNDAGFVGPTPATGSHADVGDADALRELFRLQTFNFNWDLPLEDITQMGILAPIERVALDTPTVNVDISYLVTDMFNEVSLGFDVNAGASALSAILDKSEDDKNYFRFIAPEGQDAIGEAPANAACVGFGNGFISNYSFEAAVGGFPTATVSVEAINMVGYLDCVSESVPAVDPADGTRDPGGQSFSLPSPQGNTLINGPVGSGQPSIIKPGDITFTIAETGPDANNDGLVQNLADICAQSVNVSFDLSREEIQCLGSRFASSREPQFPVTVQFQIESLLNDITAGDLSQLLCSENVYDVAINLNKADCEGGNPQLFAQYQLKNAKLRSQDFSSSIGPNHTVTHTWEGQISAEGDTTNGLFMSGVTAYGTGTGGGGNSDYQDDPGRPLYLRSNLAVQCPVVVP